MYLCTIVGELCNKCWRVVQCPYMCVLGIHVCLYVYICVTDTLLNCSRSYPYLCAVRTVHVYVKVCEWRRMWRGVVVRVRGEAVWDHTYACCLHLQWWKDMLQWTHWEPLQNFLPDWKHNATNINRLIGALLKLSMRSVVPLLSRATCGELFWWGLCIAWC